MFRRSRIRFRFTHHISSRPIDTPADIVPLCQLSPGERACIVHIEQGRRLCKRLADLGLTVGTEVRILQASRGSGAMILAIHHDARLALGRGMANKIYVRRLLDNGSS